MSYFIVEHVETLNADPQSDCTGYSPNYGVYGQLYYISVDDHSCYVHCTVREMISVSGNGGQENFLRRGQNLFSQHVSKEAYLHCDTVGKTICK